jgi:hypothetical protein
MFHELKWKSAQLSCWLQDVNIVNRVPRGGVRVWPGISYEQQTQLHFINVNFNAKRYHDEILRPMVVLFICCHHLMFQHYNIQSHVTRICTQFLEAENVPVLPWPAYSPNMSPIEPIWDALGWLVDSVFQFPPISSNFAQPLKRSGTTFHRPQSTAWSTLCDWYALRCMRQMVDTPGTDWFSDPRPYFLF